MKRLFIIGIFTALTTITMKAQDDTKTPQFGIKGGFNSSSIVGDDFNDTKSRSSFYAGLMAELPLTNRFSFQPEVMYSGQGFDIREIDQDNVFDTDQNWEYQLDYIQVPLLAKIYLIEGLNIVAGPQFGFKINEEVDYQPNTDAGDIDIDEDASYFNDFDASAVLGAGYKFNNGFLLSARYTYGLTSMFKDDTILGDVDGRNAVWQFGIGYMF